MELLLVPILTKPARTVGTINLLSLVQRTL